MEICGHLELAKKVHHKNLHLPCKKVPTFLSWVYKIAEGKINYIVKLPSLPLLLYTCHLFE